jgi:hypothetical protein
MNEDLQHLKILSVFHYVVAGIGAIFACFPIFHLTMGISMLAGGFDIPDDPAMPFPFRLFGLMFTLIPAAIMLFGWAFAVSMAVAGYFLGKQRNYMFCLVMAGISCIFTPFGTVLGVFTIIVLLRPSVKALFNYPLPVQV